MLAAYGIDTLDPGVSTRRVHVCAERLPPHFRRGGESWSIESELLAALIDHVANLTWVTLRANGAKGARRPQPVQRPASRNRPQSARQPQRREEPAAEAGQKAGSWADAAMQLAGMPGVTVRHG